MPEIPKFRTSQTRTGTRAIPTEAPLPLRAARQGEGAIGRGLVALGEGIEDVSDVFGKIKLEQIRLNDSINAAKVSAIQKGSAESLATLNSQTDLTFDEGGVSSWEKNAEESWKNLQEKIKEEGFELSSSAKQRLDAQMKIWKIERDSFVRRETSKTLVEKAQVTLPLEVEDAVASGNQNSINIAISNFNDSKERVWGARQDKADELLEDALRKGEIRRLESAAALDPQAVIDEITKELEARKRAGGAKRESELTSDELSDVMGFALIVQNRQKRIVDEVNRQDKLNLYNKEDSGELLNRKDFNRAYKDPDEADQHYDEYIRGQKAEQQGEVNFVKKGNPVVIARIEAIIDLRPNAITVDFLYENATRGLGTENITRLVNKLKKAKEGQVDDFDRKISILFNSNYFGDATKAETGLIYKRTKLVMEEYLKTQKPTRNESEVFFQSLITRDFKGFRRGGFEEKGFNHTFVDITGREITQRFRFGDIRITKEDGKTVEEFYAGTDDNGDALWLPRR